MTTTNTRAALDAAIDKFARAAIDDANALGAPDEFAAAKAAWAAISPAITAHVEAEVTRRLAAAPSVDEAIRRYGVQAAGGADTTAAEASLRAAIAAERERVPVGAPLGAVVDAVLWAVAQCHDGSDLWAHMKRDPDAFRREVARVLSGKIRNSPTPDEARRLVDAYDTAIRLAERAVTSGTITGDHTMRQVAARTALLRALGVEA